MPSTGMPRSKSLGSQCGAPGSYTLAGPPERMIPFGFSSFTRAAERSWRTTWQKTFCSRTRRAMSCPNCEPKSKMRTSSFVMGRLSHVVVDEFGQKRFISRDVSVAAKSLDFDRAIGEELDFASLTWNRQFDRHRLFAKVRQAVGQFDRIQFVEEVE